ncbi:MULTISPECIES: hypothetical protein [unclassified Treponema]|uniref:hypothetical protein n=1 Tax=unclassified Treponema TaxID=2638727 RepID=UPI0005301126|nr:MULTISPECIES: hypothetical protein [unclassified Treponema]AIW89509.1 hypothetical protein JO41_06615 [Treponema sp. OMZ 838]UTC50452.1 hypothetical protein E4N65_10350 [Treponema sp. OMZ 855]
MYLVLLKIVCVFFLVLSAAFFIAMWILYLKMSRGVTDALVEKRIKWKWWWTMPMVYWHAYPEDRKIYIMYTACFWLFIIFLFIGVFISGKIRALDWTWWL